MTPQTPSSASQAAIEHVEQLHANGYVVIEDCIPIAQVAKVRDEFLALMNAKVQRFGLSRVAPVDGRDAANEKFKIDFKPEGGNHDLNRWNMHLPSNSTFFCEQIIANPKVVEVLDILVGPGCVNFIAASDTPYPGSGFQNIHQDFPRFGLTVNIPLVDFTEENAPLEVWPGSHIKCRADDVATFHKGTVSWSQNQYQEIRSTIKSERKLIRAGSILIRDQRMVHRGTGNVSNAPRPCLSLWYKDMDKTKVTDLNFPIPSRRAADCVARTALKMRENGRSSNQISNQRLVNLGNLLGRVVEETSGSDRDYRRRIPTELWQTFSPKMQHLLRYASVGDGQSRCEAEVRQSRRPSWIGSVALQAAGLGFSALGATTQIPAFRNDKNHSSDRA